LIVLLLSLAETPLPEVLAPVRRFARQSYAFSAIYPTISLEKIPPSASAWNGRAKNAWKSCVFEKNGV